MGSYCGNGFSRKAAVSSFPPWPCHQAAHLFSRPPREKDAEKEKEKEKKVKKTIPAWATLSASQLARAQKQTQMAASSRPKMDVILIEAIKVRMGALGVEWGVGWAERPLSMIWPPRRMPGESCPHGPSRPPRRAIRKAGRRWSPSESTSSAGTLRWTWSGGGTS